MYVNFVTGIAAAVAVFVPVLLVLAGRLFQNGSLLALLSYYLLTGLYVLTTLDIITLPPALVQKSAALLNYLDAPLMLAVLLFFCPDKRSRTVVLSTLGVLLLFEAVIFFLFGLSRQSSVYLLGPGIALVFSYGLYFFSYYGKLSVVQGKSIGKTFMLVAILFLYVLFLILYYVHYLVRTPAIADVYLIYYIGLFLSSVIMSIGLACIIKRTCELKELQLTRKELALFFDK